MNRLNRNHLLIMLVMLFVISVPAFSQGNSEKPYGIVLQEEFLSLVEQLQAGDLTLQEAVAALHDLREVNGRVNGEDYGEMVGLMTAVRDKTMTKEQAMDKLCLLDEANADCSGDQLKTRDQVKDQLKDGSCDDGPIGDEIKNQNQAGGSDSSGSSGSKKG